MIFSSVSTWSSALAPPASGPRGLVLAVPTTVLVVGFMYSFFLCFSVQRKLTLHRPTSYELLQFYINCTTFKYWCQRLFIFHCTKSRTVHNPILYCVHVHVHLVPFLGVSLQQRHQTKRPVTAPTNSSNTNAPFTMPTTAPVDSPPPDSTHTSTDKKGVLRHMIQLRHQ